MQIGILGAGRIGQALAGQFVRVGHEVILANSRGPETLKPLIEKFGASARAGLPSEAAAAPIMFLCVMWAQVSAALEGLGPFERRIVVDTTNPIREVDGSQEVLDLGEQTSSEIVSGLIANARLVKACNTVMYLLLSQSPRVAGGRRVMFMSGDHAAAKDDVKFLLESIGFAPVDLGSIAVGGRMQQAGGGAEWPKSRFARLKCF